MKIFLCSTSYDLEDLRALVISKFRKKHEFIHFENAAFPSRRGLHSHDQCLEAVKQSDVVIYIIDRRYGGKYHGKKLAEFTEQIISVNSLVKGKKQTLEVKIPPKELSISWCELITAYREQKYVITFARRRTLDERATRRRNQLFSSFKAAHVDNIRIFDLIDWITKQPKDNWIIPFDNAVDFLKKLGDWLKVADETLVLPPNPIARKRKPITVVVEGQTDAEIVRVIAKKYLKRRSVSFVVAQGKRALLGNLRIYTQAFKDSAGIIVLADADTEDDGTIAAQKAQFAEILNNSLRPDTRIIFAIPEIESWLGFPRSLRGLKNSNRFDEQIRQFQQELEERRKRIPSLAEFIDAIIEIDAQSLD